MRVWLGIMWLQAGTAKLWGAENPAFLHNNGAGVNGFASHGVPAYSWWGSFMHSFVVPNSGWIAILVAVAEFSIGVALTLGLFTRIAALGSLALLFTYVMSGTASVCAFYALFAIVILATWRTSRWIGVDGLIAGYRQRHQGANSTPAPSIAVTLATDEVPNAKKSVAGLTLTTPVATIEEDVTPAKAEPVTVG
jgi:thiosulfate dehydrogenase [quinone] large subunit